MPGSSDSNALRDGSFVAIQPLLCMVLLLGFVQNGRESVRDDERCGRSREVRTPELIGQIKNFMDKDRRVSIGTISAQFDVSVGTVHTIIRKELKMRKICTKFVPRMLREDQKDRCCHDSREMVELIHSDLAILDALATCDESWIYYYDPETKGQSFQWKHAGSSRPKKARQRKSTHKIWWSLFWLYWHDLHALASHLTDSQQGILCWGFKGVQEEIPSEDANTLQIGLSGISTRTMHQSTTPSLSQTIWARRASRQFLTLPIVQTLLHVTFGYSLNSRKNLESIVMRLLRRWKRLWRRSLTRSHKRTSMGTSRSCWNITASALQPEEITLKGTRVLWVYYQ